MSDKLDQLADAAIGYAAARLIYLKEKQVSCSWALQELKRAAWEFSQVLAKDDLRARERQVESQAAIIRDLQQRELDAAAKIAELQVRLEQLQKRFDLAHETSARRGKDRDEANQRYNALLDKIRDLLPDGDS